MGSPLTNASKEPAEGERFTRTYPRPSHPKPLRADPEGWGDVLKCHLGCVSFPSSAISNIPSQGKAWGWREKAPLLGSSTVSNSGERCRESDRLGPCSAGQPWGASWLSPSVPVQTAGGPPL